MFSFLLALAHTFRALDVLSMNDDALSLPSESMTQSLEYDAPHNSLDYAEPPTPIAEHTRSHILAENPWSILDTMMMLFKLEIFAHAFKHPFSGISKAHPSGREYTKLEEKAMKLGVSVSELVAGRNASPEAVNDTPKRKRED